MLGGRAWVDGRLLSNVAEEDWPAGINGEDSNDIEGTNDADPAVLSDGVVAFRRPLAAVCVRSVLG